MSYLCRSNCVSKETKIFLIRFSLFLGFLYGGAFLFMMIEEEATKEQIEKNKAELEILKNITMDKYNMTDDEFGILVNKLKTMELWKCYQFYTAAFDYNWYAMAMVF